MVIGFYGTSMQMSETKLPFYKNIGANLLNQIKIKSSYQVELLEYEQTVWEHIE